ncbi:IPT/TIG domain-containing protein [Terriglobus roseus]|uniref:IPT/TIG domain-containing protein n=1 Tax=Terriglobus roseus TaxID=392734 RepID=A0A1H4SHN1_9BACT|nr:IPT/TIG domain-containing protein [Terriglobus roseus]SEC43608.1 IPT/TIG domain-containing protein [Terriglobus roseus]
MTIWLEPTSPPPTRPRKLETTRNPALIAVLGLCVYLAGCGQRATTVQGIGSVTPAAAPLDGGSSVTIEGSGFQPDSKISFGGAAATTTFVDQGKISAVVPPGQDEGVVDVVVQSAATGSAQALSRSFTFTGSRAQETLQSLNPSNLTVGQSNTVMVYGTNLSRSGTTIRVNGDAVPTTLIDRTHLSFTAPKLGAGTYSVTAYATDNGVSGALSLVYAAPPASEKITSIAPTSATAGTTFTLDVTGTGFPTDGKLLIGGIAATTTIVSSTEAKASVGPLTAGSYSVVLQSASTGSTQYAGSLLVTGSSTAESITAVSTTTIPLNRTVTVTVTGAGFPNGAVVTLNGQLVGTTAVQDSSHLLATMIASSPGPYTLAVRNPDGTSVTYGAPFVVESALSISSTALSSVQSGVAFSIPLTATGGLAPYAWSSSALPQGIALSAGGVLSGTVSVSAASVLSVPLTVTDSLQSSAQATARMPVTVVAVTAPVSPITTTSASGTSLTACGALSSANTTYVLQNDVQSAGTCFGITADNVTLNLNGHVIKYANSDSSRANYGVLVADCWDTQLSGIPSNLCGGSHKNPTILNGTITQGSAAAPQSHAIRLGQATTQASQTMHDLTINIAAQDTSAIYDQYPPGNTSIYNIVINDAVTAVSNRDQLLGYPIRLDYGGSTVGTNAQDVVHDVTCNGSPQGCIVSGGALLAYNNKGKLGPSQYVGGYGIFLGGNNSEAYGNSFTGATRGFEIEGSNVKLHDNTLAIQDSATVHDPGHNPDGCEIDGTYGIRVKAYAPGIVPTNVSITNNNITVTAGPCQAQGLRFTDLTGSESITVANNTFSVVQAGSTTMNSGVSLDNTDGKSIVFNGNTFNNAPSLFVFYGGYDGATNLNLNGTFTGSSTIYARCGGAACTNLNVTGLPSTPVLQCESDHLAVTVTANGKALSCP